MLKKKKDTSQVNKAKKTSKKGGFWSHCFGAFSPGGLAEPAAGVINSIDRLNDRIGHRFSVWGNAFKNTMGIIADFFSVSVPGGFSGFAAHCVEFNDKIIGKAEDFIVALAVRFYETAERVLFRLWHRRIELTAYLIGIVAVGLIMIISYNAATGYEYSYNGKVLGVVKNQEDIILVLDVAQDSLTNEYGIDVAMDPQQDFSYRKVVILNRTVDDCDTVLSKLSYMKDTKVSAFGIFADGKMIGVLNTKKDAEKVLNNVKYNFINSDGRDAVYEEISFAENIHIKQITVNLSSVRSVNTMTNAIIYGGTERTKYVVKSGDTFGEIAQANNISAAELKAMNPGVDDVNIHVGDELWLDKAIPLLTVKTVEVAEYYTYQDYSTEYRDTSSMYKGDSKTQVAGVKGKTWVKARVTRENGQIIKQNVLDSKKLSDPVTEVILRGTAKRPPTVGTGHLINPCPAGSQSSPFGYRWGRMHEGVDLAAPSGSVVRAADGGVVTTAGWGGTYGNMILINHQNGMVTRYAHLSGFAVHSGSRVYQGQTIGYVGSTGRSTGPHLHFEVRVNGGLRNPRSYF